MFLLNTPIHSLKSGKTLGTALVFFLTSLLALGQFSLKKIQAKLVYDNPPFNSCHAATIEEVEPGAFLVASFAGTDEGNKDVCIYLSRGTSKGWGKPYRVADGIMNDTLRFPTWNPVLFKTVQNKLFLFYKVGPEPSKWWGMVKTSTDNGKSWGAAQNLPEGILGPIKNKPLQLANGTILSPSSTENYSTPENWPWKLFLEKSEDEGVSWHKIPIDTASAYNAIQPSVLLHPDNTIQLLARSRDSALIQSFSKDRGASWGQLTKSSLPNPNSGTDAIALKNGWFVLAYNPTLPGTNGRAKLNLAVSKDGHTWSDAVILEDENEGEFSYPTIMEASDHAIHVVYTYNRVNIKHVVLKQRN